jgi:hypothetical protein
MKATTGEIVKSSVVKVEAFSDRDVARYIE